MIAKDLHSRQRKLAMEIVMYTQAEDREHAEIAWEFAFCWRISVWSIIRPGYTL